MFQDLEKIYYYSIIQTINIHVTTKSLFMLILARLDMLTLHVLTFIDILQHICKVFCLKCAIYILFNSTMSVLPV